MITIKKISTKKLVLCALFAALIVVGTFIRVPFITVPFTLQQLMTNLAGMLLGPVYGGISVLVYIFMGLLGLPVFTQGGGIGYILKPSFGYIIGFALGAFVTGKITYASKKPSFVRLLVASFAGLAAVYICGMFYFWIISRFYLGTTVGLWKLLWSCCLVFIPGDAISCIAGTFVAKKVIPAVNKIIK